MDVYPSRRIRETGGLTGLSNVAMQFDYCLTQGYLDGRSRPDLYFYCMTYMNTHKDSFQFNFRRRGDYKEVDTFRGTIKKGMGTGSKGFVATRIIVLLVILLSIATVLIETLPYYSPTVYPPMKYTWFLVELITTIVLAADLLVRFVAEYYKVRMIFTFSFIFDVVCLLPIFVYATNYYNTIWATLFKSVRVMRLFRTFSLYSFADMTAVLVKRVFATYVQLALVSLALVFFITALLAGTLVYDAEIGDYDPVRQGYFIKNFDCSLRPRGELGFDSCPDKEVRFVSMLETFFVVFSAMLPVGYTSFGPISVWGKVIVSFTILMGISILAVPLGALGKRFIDVMHALKERQRLDRRDDLAQKLKEHPFSITELRLFLIEMQLEDALRKCGAIIPQLRIANPVLARHVEQFVRISLFLAQNTPRSALEEVLEKYNADLKKRGHQFEDSVAFMLFPRTQLKKVVESQQIIDALNPTIDELFLDVEKMEESGDEDDGITESQFSYRSSGRSTNVPLPTPVGEGDEDIDDTLDYMKRTGVIVNESAMKDYEIIRD